MMHAIEARHILDITNILLATYYGKTPVYALFCLVSLGSEASCPRRSFLSGPPPRQSTHLDHARARPIHNACGALLRTAGRVARGGPRTGDRPRGGRDHPHAATGALPDLRPTGAPRQSVVGSPCQRRPRGARDLAGGRV